MKCALFLVSGLLALTAVSGAATNSPVERVVNLLKDLKQKLVLDEKSEQKVYDKYACWCEKTTSRKAANIDQATADLRVLGQSILRLKGAIATLASEIDQLAEDIKLNKEQQAEATAIRQKENEAWMAESAETKQALAALQQAVTVLVNATTYEKGAALLQQQARAGAAVRKFVEVMPGRASFKPDEVALLSEFLGSVGSEKYAPQSWSVQGILKDMYETFSADLEAATQLEAKQNTDFETFIAVKTEELKAMEALKKAKEDEKATKESELADTQAIYDDTLAQKQADVKFFDETKAVCEAKHEAWTTRSSLREEEIAGIEKALEILTTDEARELFASSIKAGKETGMSDSYDTGRDISYAPAFLQVGSDTNAPNMRAFAALKASASKTHSLRLAALAVQVREAKVGHFDKVLAAIDAMVQVLKDEDASDIAKRDQCKGEYQKIESTIKDLTWKIEKNEAKIDSLAALIEKHQAEKAKTVVEIEDVTSQMEAMTTERTEENEAFLNAKKEDQDTIDLLMQARDMLSAYYKKNGVAMGEVQGSVKGVFAQQGPEFDVSQDQAPDAVFSDKGKRKDEAKGIIQIMTMIIEDVDDEIKNGMQAEEQAQLEYEGLMAAAQKLKDELIAKRNSLTVAISKREAEKSDEEQLKQSNEADLSSEETYKADITPDCDWILGAFHKRAEARATEMQGLVGAREFLVGYQNSEAALLQSSRQAFDDGALGSLKFLGLRK